MSNSMQSLEHAVQESCRKWKIDSRNEKTLNLSSVFVFSDSFPGFDGHFPGQPVLPAIIQLAAVRYIAECSLGQPLVPTNYERTKFRGIIQPDEEIEITLALHAEKKQWVGKFAIKRSAKEIVANGTCTFKERANTRK